MSFIEILQPKFLWKNLDLSFFDVDTNCFDRERAIANISALCKASTPDAEADIELANVDFIDNAIILNCNSITMLTIDPEMFAFENYLRPVVSELTDLTNLSLDHGGRYLLQECNGIKFPTRIKTLLQPLFDQITHLTLPADFMEATNPNHFYALKFPNLESLTISIHKLWWGERLLLLKKFCLRNSSLTHLNVRVGSRHETYESFENFSLTRFYDRLHSKTRIESCKLLIHSSLFECYVHWRTHFDGTLEQLFGENLSENEKNFFV